MPNPGAQSTTCVALGPFSSALSGAPLAGGRTTAEQAGLHPALTGHLLTGQAETLAAAAQCQPRAALTIDYVVRLLEHYCFQTGTKTAVQSKTSLCNLYSDLPILLNF